jgi:hypothetical protein
MATELDSVSKKFSASVKENAELAEQIVCAQERNCFWRSFRRSCRHSG